MNALLSRGAAIFVVLLLLVNANTTASAQTGSTQGTVSLMGQTDWNTGTNPFDLDIKVNTNLDPTNAELVVTLYNQIHNRFQFQQSEQGKITGASVILERHPLSDVLGPDGDAHVELPVQDPNQKRYYLKDPGIYPVSVDLRTADTGTVISRFVTHLINEPAPPAPAVPLGVAIDLPVQAAPSTQTSNPLAAPDQGSTFATVGKTLAAHPATPATLIPEPESVQRLISSDNDDAGHSLNQFKTSVDQRPVEDTTWVPVPPPLYGSETAGEVTQQINSGTSVLRANFQNIDSQDWTVTDQIDSTALTTLKSKGFSDFVIPEADLTPQQRATTLARPFNISLGKKQGNVTAGMADQGLSSHFTDTNGPILDAHQLLADLAVLWNDLPGQQRGAIVMPPRSWNPDPGFLETLFRGLDASPILKAETVSQYFTTPYETTGSTTLTRSLNSLPKSEYSSYPGNKIVDDRKMIDGFSTLVDPDNKMLSNLQQQLLLAERTDVDAKTRDSELDTIHNSVNHQVSLIHMPAERSIRLTARSGTIPVSVLNDTGYPVHVTIELTSNKLDFPDGSTRSVELERQHVTEEFTVETRTSGAFPVQVKLISPDGQTVIERSSITVRSTATSAVGVGLSIGAGAFLIIWWIRSAITTRRKKRSLAAQTPFSEPGPAPA